GLKVQVENLIRLIESTEGDLIKVCIDLSHDTTENERIIKTIYQNCPNLMHLKLCLKNFINNNILELEKLLINCQHLNELQLCNDCVIYWNKLFKILINSSPINLFKFKFRLINIDLAL